MRDIHSSRTGEEERHFGRRHSYTVMAENLTIFSPFIAEQRYKGNEPSFLKIHRDFVFIKVGPNVAQTGYHIRALEHHSC